MTPCKIRGSAGMRKKYKVKLTPSQRKQLLEVVHKGKQKAKTITHARILLQADSGEEGPGLRAKAIAAGLNIHERSVHRAENLSQTMDWKLLCTEKNIANTNQENSMVIKKPIWLPYVAEPLRKGAKNGP